MAKLLLDNHTRIPSFQLLAREGWVFDSLSLRRRKNLVIFFLSSLDNAFLIRTEEACRDIQRQSAEVVVVSFSSVDEIQDIHRQHRLRFCILSDEERGVLSRFVRAAQDEEFAALFVADKSGTLFFQYLADGPNKLPSFDEITKALVFIESQSSQGIAEE